MYTRLPGGIEAFQLLRSLAPLFLVAKCISLIFIPTTGRHGNLIHELTELQIETVTTGLHPSLAASLFLPPAKIET